MNHHGITMESPYSRDLEAHDVRNVHKYEGRRPAASINAVPFTIIGSKAMSRGATDKMIDESNKCGAYGSLPGSHGRKDRNGSETDKEVHSSESIKESTNRNQSIVRCRCLRRHWPTTDSQGSNEDAVTGVGCSSADSLISDLRSARTGALVLAASKVDSLFGDLRTARECIEAGTTLVVLRSGRALAAENERGITPLIRIYRECRHILDGSVVGDRVVGLAAAALYCAARIRGLYCPVLSTPAYQMLKSAEVVIEYGHKVPYILGKVGKDGTGICPLEKMTVGYLTSPNARIGDGLGALIDRILRFVGQ